uniref:Uncharacterized protein n=2 Tax=Ixodes scapularis TaxID=6945 RepID=A0A1S4KNS1_IXOSC
SLKPETPTPRRATLSRLSRSFPPPPPSSNTHTRARVPSLPSPSAYPLPAPLDSACFPRVHRRFERTLRARAVLKACP